MIRVTAHAGGANFAVKVVPGASRDRVMGALGDALKITVSKPPSGGDANRAVIALLAKHLDLQKAQIQIVRGQTSARKEILVTGCDIQDLSRKLGALEG